jgi:uncharacterized SAM-dependent methyltransferase
MASITSQSLMRDPAHALEAQVGEQLVRPAAPLVLDLSQPYNMYLTPAQAQSYLALMKDDTYRTPFHDPIKNLFGKHTRRILQLLDGPLALIDLGPGFPDKTLPLFAYLKQSLIACTYVPVDINRHFLDLAASTAQAEGFGALPLNCLFEEIARNLPSVLSQLGSRSAVVIFGLTFMNYSPERVSRLLTDLGPMVNRVVVAAELHTLPSPENMLLPYKTTAAEDFNFQVLKLLRWNRSDFDYKVRFVDNHIEMGFSPKVPVPLGGSGHVLTPSTYILTAVSYRYTLRQFHSLLTPLFTEVEVVTDPTAPVALAILGNC